MPKFNEQENQFWTQLMHDCNADKPRMCYVCNNEIPAGEQFRHNVAHPGKNMYEVWSPVPIDTTTRLRILDL